MPEGTLEVLLVSAKGLHDTDILCKGSNPQWKETFLFDVSSRDSTDLKIKILDSDGDVPPKSYNIMKDDAYCGEIRIGLNFTAQKSRSFEPTDRNIGGWKQSGRD
ncbi:hypothetical protein E3N88_35957 [Mikania micrantha]|uniref:C2 domain-containing protein n=1 Tax=Mikania micrantha TaxID=192012 RepID=A0A5N6M2H9_9ASTR|nr:hypothetical protein E3N88_35957 [Mikania micrantha]